MLLYARILQRLRHLVLTQNVNSHQLLVAIRREWSFSETVNLLRLLRLNSL